jgi:hypothetical protein
MDLVSPKLFDIILTVYHKHSNKHGLDFFYVDGYWSDLHIYNTRYVLYFMRI